MMVNMHVIAMVVVVVVVVAGGTAGETPIFTAEESEQMSRTYGIYFNENVSWICTEMNSMILVPGWPMTCDGGYVMATLCIHSHLASSTYAIQERFRHNVFMKKRAPYIF